MGADGRVWRLHRRLVPREPRWPGWGFRDHRARRRARNLDDPDGSGAALDVAAEAGVDAAGCLGELPGIGAIVAVLAVVLLLWFVVLPALVLLLDVVIVALVSALTIAARIVLRRPWTSSRVPTVRPRRPSSGGSPAGERATRRCAPPSAASRAAATCIRR